MKKKKKDIEELTIQTKFLSRHQAMIACSRGGKKKNRKKKGSVCKINRFVLFRQFSLCLDYQD